MSIYSVSNEFPVTFGRNVSTERRAALLNKLELLKAVTESIFTDAFRGEKTELKFDMTVPEKPFSSSGKADSLG